MMSHCAECNRVVCVCEYKDRIALLEDALSELLDYFTPSLIDGCVEATIGEIDHNRLRDTLEAE